MPEIGETFFAASRDAWRDWLAGHHRDHSEIWLLLYKKHVSEPCVSYDEAVEEALCFGWIDGILKRIDDQQHVVRFSPRRSRSGWATSNKERVERLVEQGRMTEAGMAVVRAAQEDGSWDELQRREEAASTIPADLGKALARNKRAKDNFAAFAPSHRKAYVAWVLDAKREQTRKRRVAEVVKRAADNRKPGE